MTLRSVVQGALATALVATTVGPNSASAVTSVRINNTLSNPLYVCAPPGDERIFVVQQTGEIVILNQTGTEIATFLDIDPLVLTSGERGLLGMAFSPTYETDRLFYVNYTNNSGSTVIARYQTDAADPNQADPGSAEILLTIAQPFSNHNGGRILFGSDGYLYIGMGDGGSGGDPGNRAQTLSQILGKILRIDVSGGLGSGYSVPPSNPFADGGGLGEIWAYGIRNPWGMDFDPDTGDFYFCDVGQNAWEELNVEPAGDPGGLNYGWRVMEGTHCYNPPSGCNTSGKVLPVHEYSHSLGCSVTGGMVYRGSIAEIDGHYFFADYCSRRIWSFVWDGGGGISSLVERTSELVPDVGIISSIVGFGRDGFGEMYICDHGGELFKVIEDPVSVPDTTPLRPDVVRAAPNPFKGVTKISFGMEPGVEVSVTILDTQGRVVRSLYEGVVAGELAWDGRDDTGREMAAGIYLVRVEADGITTQSRVTLFK